MVDVDEETCKKINETLAKTRVGEASWVLFYSKDRAKDKYICDVKFNNVNNFGLDITLSHISDIDIKDTHVESFGIENSSIDFALLLGSEAKKIESDIEIEYVGVDEYYSNLERTLYEYKIRY